MIQIRHAAFRYYQDEVCFASSLHFSLILTCCRMQSIEARKEYKNSFVCAARIFKEEGIFTFWSGAVPRLARLILSGGIVFTM